MAMETITVTGQDWFDLSAKLNEITLTDGKTYTIQSMENQISCYQGVAVPTGIAGNVINPVFQLFKFTFKTGDVIALKVNNYLNLATLNHITISEVA